MSWYQFLRPNLWAYILAIYLMGFLLSNAALDLLFLAGAVIFILLNTASVTLNHYFDAETDNADFPTEWLETITYNLALRMASAFGKDQKVMPLILPIATTLLLQMRAWDTESGSLYLMPDKHYE